jgi:hypothetical protein
MVGSSGGIHDISLNAFMKAWDRDSRHEKGTGRGKRPMPDEEKRTGQTVSDKPQPDRRR